MTKKRRTVPEVEKTITVDQVLSTLGIEGMRLIMEMDTCDPNEWYDRWLHLKDDFETALLVMGETQRRYQRLFRVLVVDLPEGIGAVLIPNPLLELKAKEAQSKDQASRAEDTGDDPSITDTMPF